MVKRLFEDKRAVFFISLLAVLSLVLLAGTLNNISFQPAKPLYRLESDAQAPRISMGEVTKIFLEIPLWKQVLFFVMIFLVVVMIASLLSPEARKQMIRMFIRGAISVLLVSYLIKKNPNLLQNLFPQLNLGNGIIDTAPLENVAPPVFEPPQISGMLSFLITLGFVIIVAVLTWRIYLWWKRQNEALNAPNPLDEIVKIARASLHELSQQGSSHDSIIQCYENMSQALYMRRGLQRSYAMTAAEFAQRLENAGLPREPVNHLTRLFESARYGARASTQTDIDEAVSCLKTILKHCGESL
jgi:hypothetical protein